MEKKNHFLISYAGNKRKECQNIYESIKDKLSSVDTIVEPFCGSSAVSFYISKLHPKHYKYVLNDNNKHLIELYKIASSKRKLKKFIEEIETLVEDITKDVYIKLVKEDNVQSWFIKNKIYNIRPGFFPTNIKIKQDFSDLEDCPIIHFLRTEKITFTNIDAKETLVKYKDNKKAFIFLDPPYLDSCNDFYADSNTNIYEYLYNNKITAMRSKVLLCLEDNWIIRLLFNGDVKSSYDKKYEISKKKTRHMIIANY